MANDIFGKLYKKSKLDRRSTKSDSRSMWLRNATRSVGDSAFKVVQEYIPAVTETAVSIKDIRSDLRNSLVNTKRAGITKAGALMSLGKEVWKNSLDDLKTGNFVNNDRLKALEDDDPFGNFDIDFDLPEDFDSGEDDFSADIVSEDGMSSVQMNRKSDGTNEITQINIDTNLDENSAVVRATERQTEVSIQAAQGIADVSEVNTKVMMTHLSKLGNMVNGQLASINDNISSIATVVSESVTAHVSVSAKYYEDSIELFKSMDTKLKDISDLIKMGSSTNQTQHDVYEGSDSRDVFTSSGGLDLKEYGALVKKQFHGALSNSSLGMILSMGSMVTGNPVGPSMLDEFKASPLSTVLKSVIKSTIPGAVKVAAETFGEQFKETLSTGLFKINGLKMSNNPILQFVGNMFGVSNSKYTADKRNYNKGPMAWNGIAHRTLVDVIPTYLSQIAASVTGTEQRVFDYEKGVFASLKSIREEHEDTLKRKELSPFYNIRNQFSDFVKNFDLSNDDKEKYRTQFDKYMTDVARSHGQMSFTNRDELVGSVGDEQIATMIQKFMRYAPKNVVTAAYGSNVLDAVNDLSEYNRKIEKDPTKYNYQYIDNGMTEISGSNSKGLFGLEKDKYKHDKFYYLRKILQTINTVVPVRIIQSKGGFNKQTLSEISKHGTSSSHSTNSNSISSSSNNTTTTGGISLDDLNNLSEEELAQKINDRNRYLNGSSKESKILKGLKSLGVKEDTGIYKLFSNLVGGRNKAGERGASVFNKMTDTLFAILFGTGDDHGVRGAVNSLMDGVKVQMKKFGTFIDDKMIKPLNESLFGEEGLITKIKESETIKNIKSKLNTAKNKSIDFIFGTKGEDGKRRGGLLSDTMNSLSDMGTKAKDFILHDEDGIVGSMKSMYKSVTLSVKKSLGVETDDEKEKVPLSKRISDGASDFLTHIKQRGSEWADLIFGGSKTKTKQDKEKIINGLDIFKSDMKGNGGKVAASATVGLIGSFFLPGGPIVGALLGLGAGIVSQSSQLKELLFGKLNEDGTRSDSGIISQQFQNFFKENKTGMSIGTFAGLMSSIGLLPALFVPGGPIGGAIIGGAISLANKSGALDRLLYGEDGSKDNITGGITKFVKDHYKKDGNVKTTFMDAGLGAGVGLIGSFFLPGGPIIGSLVGAATSIAINSDKFKNFMFGKEELDKDGNPTGKRKGGVLKKFTDFIGDKVLLPFTKAARVTQVKMLGFVEKHMVNPFKVAIKPFQLAGKNFVDGIKSTVDDLKESFKTRVTKPIGDAVEEHILKPMRSAFSKIFGGLGKIIGSIISAPFKIFQGAASGLNKTQLKRGETDYDMEVELERLNMRTDAKTKRNLKKTRKENKKRKHFRDFFGRGKTTNQSKNSSNSQTKVKSPDESNVPYDYYDAIHQRGHYSDEDLKEIYGEINGQNEEYKNKTTVAKKSSSNNGGSSDAYTSSEWESIVNERNAQNEEARTRVNTNTGGMPNNVSHNTHSADISSTNTGGSVSSESNGTKVSAPEASGVNISGGNNADSASGNKTTIQMDLRRFSDNYSSNSTSILNKLDNIISIITHSGRSDSNSSFNQSASNAKVSKKDNPANVPRNISSIEVNVGKIKDSVDGQLNGVGYNVNKILRILLKKNNMDDSDVEGSNNKKYSRFGRLKRFLSKPVNLIRGMINGAVDAVRGVVSGVVGGVTRIAKGLLEIPKLLLKTGIKAVKGIGSAVLGIAKGIGKVVSTGLNIVGNVLVSAASGFGKMIGRAAAGFGKLIGGALGGIGNLLHGLGIIGKELAPVIGKAIAGIIKAPFKLAGIAGSFIGKLFGKKKGTRESDKVSHVIVDKYMGENRVISALKAIEFAIIHGAPIDGKGPKYKNTTELPVDDPKTSEDESGRTTVSFPYSLQFFANQGKNGNGLPNVKRAETKEEEQAELATRVAEGSASEINERFDQEDDKKEERSFREKLLGLFNRNNKEQKEQGKRWSSMFGKKGLIAGALLLAAPLIIKALPIIGKAAKWVIDNLGDLLGKIADWLGDTAKNVAENAESQGGITGVANGVGEQVTSVHNLLGGDRKEYVIGENGEILTDESGTTVKESTDDGLLRRVSEFYTPTTTKIDHETGEAYQTRQYDMVSRGKIHGTRGYIVRKINKTKKVFKEGSKPGVGTRIANRIGLNTKAIPEAAKTLVDDGAKKAVNTTKTVASKVVANDKVSKIIKLGKSAFDTLAKKFTELVKKHAPKAAGKISQITKFISKHAAKVFKPNVVLKFMGKFGKVLSKIAVAAGTLMTSEVFWGVTGAVEGATNAAYTFEVDSSDVDFKMRLISGVFRALLATSIGSFVDIADSIIYEISGTSFVNELANLVYSVMSGDDDVEDLKEAQAKFDAEYEKYVEEEYEAYKKNQEENGQDYMSMDEFKQSDLSTSRQEYNSEQNKSIFKKGWDAVTGAGRKVGNVVKKGVTTVKKAAGGVVGTVKKVGGGAVNFVKNGITTVKNGANNLATTVKDKWDNSKLKQAVDGMSNFGSTLSRGFGGIIKHAWTGNDDDLITFPKDDDGIGTAITKYALIGGKVLLSPVTSIIKIARIAKDGFKGLVSSVSTIGGQIAHSTGGRISAALKGEDYQGGDFEGDGPVTQICSVIDTIGGFLMAPIVGGIKLGRLLGSRFKILKDGVGSIGSQIGESIGGRISAAWKGEDYESKEIDGDGDSPITKIRDVIETVAGFVMAPISLGVRAIRVIADALSPIWKGVKKFGSNLASYVDVFGSETTIENYWKKPDSGEGFVNGLSTIFFYTIRGVLAIPFYLTQAVKNIGGFIKDKIGGFANGVADFFGAGSAFNVEDDDRSGGSGGFGGSAPKTSVKKTNLNGFTYYSQNDSDIKDVGYNQTDGTPGTMGERGCGPTALSMVASEVTGQNYDPVTMAKIAENNGYSTDVGTTPNYFNKIGSAVGMNVSSNPTSPMGIQQSLASGKPVILQGAGGSNSPYTSKGHYVVGVGMKNGKVLINDPRGTQYSKAYSMDSVMNGAENMWSFSGGYGPDDKKTTNTGNTTANPVWDTSQLTNTNPYMQKLSSTGGTEQAEQAVVGAMYSIKDKIDYSMTGPRNPEEGSADCSSTVQWAYRKALGIDPGSNTRSQVDSSTGHDVDQSTGGPPVEGNLRPGDLLFYSKNGTHAKSDVGHVEMYVGDGKLMGHGGPAGKLGPTEKTMSSYRVKDYIGAKRFIGDGTNVVNNSFASSSPSSATGVSSDTSTSTSNDSGGFSIMNLLSGAIDAVKTGISNFFGMNSSSDTSASAVSGSSTGSDGTSISAANVDAGDEQRSIWQYWIQQGLTKEGTAGLMGNLEQESGNHSVRVQGDFTPPYQKSQEYTNGVDNGSYSDSNFVNDKKGYGLAQWTFSGRKQGLLDAARANGKSIGDLGTQLAYLNHELNTKYPGVLNTLKTASDIKTASNAVLHDFEAPKDQSATVENQRASLGQGYYDKFANLSSVQTAAGKVYDTSQLQNNNPYQMGGMGEGPKRTPTTRTYQSHNKVKQLLGGMGPVSSDQSISKLPTPNYSSTQNKPYGSTMENMGKLFDYLGKIVGYLEATSSGISQLNQKEFGGNANYVNSPSYTNVNGGKGQEAPPDTSSYEFGRMIARGQLV